MELTVTEEMTARFLSTIQDYRNYAYKELCALKNHAWNRAVISESMELTVTEENSECREGPEGSPGAAGGPVTKSTRMVRRNTNKTPHVVVYRRYFKDLEVEFYFKLRHTARNLVMYYTNAYDMFEKNWEKVV